MSSYSIKLQQQISTFAEQITELLSQLLVEQAASSAPANLLEAKRYAVLSGGKRLRPFLVHEVARLHGRAGDGVDLVGAALEFIHCYSLVHDDLPAMDDDELRRGQPTTHIKFGEATAILVGDGLQSLAFELLTRDIVHRDPIVRLHLVKSLAEASGSNGMVGGQWLDLAAEGRFSEFRLPRNEATVRKIQALKTGALLRYACVAGATVADAADADLKRMTRFGEIIGFAFQIADDILDQTGDATTLGKAVGKDTDAGKATLVNLWGLEKARKYLDDLVSEAEGVLSPYGSAADTLMELAHFIAERKS